MPNLVDTYCYNRGAIIRIVGISHTNYDRNRITPGQKVMLVKEPTNFHDENAIMVLDSETNEKIGYVAASHYWKDDSGCVLAKDIYPYFNERIPAIVMLFTPAYLAKTYISIGR